MDYAIKTYISNTRISLILNHKIFFIRILSVKVISLMNTYILDNLCCQWRLPLLFCVHIYLLVYDPNIQNYVDHWSYVKIVRAQCHQLHIVSDVPLHLCHNNHSMSNPSFTTPNSNESFITDFKADYDNAILKEFGPHSNSKCFNEVKRSEYIMKLLETDISKEFPKQLKEFYLGDVIDSWDQSEWRIRSNVAQKVHLWTMKTFSSSSKNIGIIRRVIVLEEFYDLIKSHHEWPNKDGFNGQKKLFNLLKIRYACLPRDAVDKYITMWRKVTLQMSKPETTSIYTNKDTMDEQTPKNGIVRANSIKTVYYPCKEINMVENAIITSVINTEDFPRKQNSSESTVPSSIDNLYKFSGVSMVYLPQVSSYSNSIASPLLNIKYKIETWTNKLFLSENNSSNSILKRDFDISNQGSSNENNFDNDDIISSKRRKVDEGKSGTNTDNEEVLNDNCSHINEDISLKVSGIKKPSDIDMAYNIFVRRLIDSSLNRTITFCEQPKHIIQTLENICINAFQMFEKSRHRIKIRGYLKACRRNSKKHNGKILMKDTPSHMCSEKAYTIANEAFFKAENEIKNLKVAVSDQSGTNPLSISKQVYKHGSVSDGKGFDYTDLSMSSTNLAFPFPKADNLDNEELSSMFTNFLPHLYGMIPLPPLLTPNVGELSHEIILPPPAHSNEYPNSLFSVMDGCSHYTTTTHLLDKILHTSSIDPDFGMDLIVNRTASQEAINCMRLTARYLQSRSVMIESYLCSESAKINDILSEDLN